MSAANDSDRRVPDSLVAEAAEWCARMDVKDFSPAEDLELRGWLADDARRRAAFESVSRVMTDPALTAALREFDRETASNAMRVPSQSATERRHRSTWLPATFAVMLMMAGLIWLASMWMNPVLPPQLVVSTAPGQTRTLSLADGSSVHLSGGTTLEVQMEPSRRIVRMQAGEAFFTVAPDSERPFIVTIADARVQVLGTAFDLSETHDGLELSVYHGRVAFGHGDRFAEAIEVKAGERAYLHDGVASAVMPFDPEGGDWRNGWLQTNGITLAALAQRLSRRFGVDVSVAPALADKRIAGRFRVDGSDKLLQLLSSVHGFEVKRTAGGLAIVEGADSKISDN
jgi:transmembrane sensor